LNSAGLVESGHAIPAGHSSTQAISSAPCISSRYPEACSHGTATSA